MATINFFNFMFFALFVLYAVRYLHIRPGELGVLLGAGAVGGVLGAATRRISTGPGSAGPTSWAASCSRADGARAAGRRARPVILGMVFTAEFVSGFGVMVLDISIGAIFAAVIPDRSGPGCRVRSRRSTTAPGPWARWPAGPWAR